MKAGSKVMCVKQLWCNVDGYEVKLPVKGNIYTVRCIEKFAAGTGILLQEISNKPFKFSLEGTQEPYFPIGTFREIKPINK